MDEEVVWVKEPWSCWATVVSRGAYFSLVEIPDEGQVQVENDDFEEWSERAIEFDESDDEE